MYWNYSFHLYFHANKNYFLGFILVINLKKTYLPARKLLHMVK